MKKLVVALLILAMHLVPVSAPAADAPEQAVSLVRKAVAFYKENGLEKTLEVLSDAKGPMRDGALYVFAYDLTGTMLAHPNNSLIGQNLVGVPDPDGKFFRNDIVKIAANSGNGWVDYKYENPKSKAVEKKSTYLEKSGEIILCCGIYKK